MKLAINIMIPAVMISLLACTNIISSDVTQEGLIQGEPNFPKIEDSYQPEGIFPNRENLMKIAPGLSKKELYHLIGRPHFSEINGAHEWDLIFRFRQVVNGPITTCQYKVTFDNDMIAQGFYWLPVNCESQYYRTHRQEKIDLSSDTLFPFNRGTVGDIKPAGKTMLAKLAQQTLKEGNRAKLTIRGYTDYIGNDDYNQQLSQQRANSVKAYLVSQGVKSAHITAEGMGESNPVVQCKKTGRKALIACLAPNRRVNIEISQ